MQCYRSKHHALRTYVGPNATAQVTEFGARMFGTWTALSYCIHFYSACEIQHEGIYVLAFFTYVIALAHFGVEWLEYGTMAAGIELLRVAVAPVVSISWMLLQWDFYAKRSGGLETKCPELALFPRKAKVLW